VEGQCQRGARNLRHPDAKGPPPNGTKNTTTQDRPRPCANPTRHEFSYCPKKVVTPLTRHHALPECGTTMTTLAQPDGERPTPRYPTRPTTAPKDTKGRAIRGALVTTARHRPADQASHDRIPLLPTGRPVDRLPPQDRYLPHSDATACRAKIVRTWHPPGLKKAPSRTAPMLTIGTKCHPHQAVPRERWPREK
jgi:hypothetical protein